MFKSMCILGAAILITACGRYEFQGQSSEHILLSTARAQPALMDQYSCGGNSIKVEICHVPPGNPANKHTLCIGRSAVDAHVGHHQAANGEEDYLGKCDGSAPGGGDPGGDPSPNPPPTPGPSPDPIPPTDPNYPVDPSPTPAPLPDPGLN